MPFDAPALAAPPAKTERRIAELDRTVAAGMHSKLFVAAQCVASVKGAIFHRSWVGNLTAPPPLNPASHTTLFDLAQLTMPLCTAVAALHLVATGRLDVHKKVSQILGDFKGPPFDQISLDMLLDHSSGLPADNDLTVAIRRADRHLAGQSKTLGTRRSIPLLQEALRAAAAAAAPAAQTCVSNLGFVLLGWVLEAVVAQPLASFVNQEIYTPLGIADGLSFPPAPTGGAKASYATSGSCAVRRKALRGEVMDLNSYAQGGGAGHAGLFGHATAVWRLCQTLLQSYEGRPTLFHSGTLKRFWTRSRRFETTRTLGWDTPVAQRADAGGRLPSTAVGHVSSAGHAVWIDPHHSMVGVFLCNAASGREADLQRLRARLFALMTSWAGKGPPPADGAEAWALLQGGDKL